MITKHKEIPKQYLEETKLILQSGFPEFKQDTEQIQNDTLRLEGTWYLLHQIPLNSKDPSGSSRVIGCALVKDDILYNVCIKKSLQNKKYGSSLVKHIVKDTEHLLKDNKKLSLYIDHDKDYEKNINFYKRFSTDIDISF